MDEAGALPVLALDPAPGHRVLDACAGGGGKTALIAGMVGPAGEVLALDHSPRAIRRLSEAVTRLGLATVRIAFYDAREAGRRWPDAFPRVLVDAPCSGLGTLRRRPEIKWRRRPEDLRRAALLQGALLDGVAGAVAPGGLLVYSTCSLEPEETDEVIDAFLAHRPEFTPEAAGPALQPFVDPAARGRMRAWPHRHETDGFFIARLRRGA
jgi:16S rRNA (cytosine967-C5)-methyltransferase